MIERLRRALLDTGKKEINKGISRGWWDEECEMTKEVRKELRNGGKKIEVGRIIGGKRKSTRRCVVKRK